MAKPLKIFIGYDSREDIAWRVCRHSIQRHASADIEVHAIRQDELRRRGLYTRPPDAATTEFSLTRFLTPHLADHDGWTLFADCDFLFTADIARVLDDLEPGKAVHVVKHDYEPARATKMDGRRQTAYPCKNWSSFMLFDGAHPACKVLTREEVNSATPLFLHQFQWLPDQSLIGSLPLKWNFLEGEYPVPDAPPNAIHFTNGGPWFDECGDVAFADLWRAEKAMMEDRAA